MQITKYICELLKDYDCVIIPELGAFVANYSASEISYDKHVFTPPSKNILFNRNILHNDGLLATYLSKKTGLDYNQAKEEIEKFVNSCWDKFESGKVVKFDSVGDLQLDDNQNVIFQEDESANLFMDSFGLEPIQVLPVKKEIDEVRVLTPVVEVEEIEEEDEDDVLYRRLSRILIPASVAASILIAISLNFNFIKNSYIEYSGMNVSQEEDAMYYTERDELSIIPFEEGIDEIEAYLNKVEISKEEDIVSEIETETDNQVKESYNKTPKQEVKKLIEKNFHIIGGCFGEYENASIFVKSLKKEGYDAEILDEKRNGLFVAVYGSYSDENKARNLLKSLKSKGKSDVWLLKK